MIADAADVPAAGEAGDVVPDAAVMAVAAEAMAVTGATAGRDTKERHKIIFLCDKHELSSRHAGRMGTKYPAPSVFH